MNTKAIYLTLGALLLVIIGGGFLLYGQLAGTGPVEPVGEPYKNPYDNTDNYIPYSATTGSGATVSIPTSSGGTIIVKDFLKSSDVYSDAANSGQYSLGYHIDPSSDVPVDAPYIITYLEASGFFNITLLQEPVAESRQKAEQYLMVQLGIGEPGMCHLKYMVGVPNRVNPIYSGLNLGWSFCPRATQL